MLRGEKKEKNIERVGVSDSDGEPNHLPMGAQNHKTDCTQTHTHICSFLCRAKKHGGDS